eukprot:GHVN01078393.1.p1 GENE.GHVN01078393.1~~GHVN01078393.1.p1  ORF type:complete len:944 (+),score=63.39 GHVN01078393.1:169-2832(+)
MATLVGTQSHDGRSDHGPEPILQTFDSFVSLAASVGGKAYSSRCTSKSDALVDSLLAQKRHFLSPNDAGTSFSGSFASTPSEPYNFSSHPQGSDGRRAPLLAPISESANSTPCQKKTGQPFPLNSPVPSDGSFRSPFFREFVGIQSADLPLQSPRTFSSPTPTAGSNPTSPEIHHGSGLSTAGASFNPSSPAKLLIPGFSPSKTMNLTQKYRWRSVPSEQSWPLTPTSNESDNPAHLPVMKSSSNLVPTTRSERSAHPLRAATTDVGCFQMSLHRSQQLGAERKPVEPALTQRKTSSPFVASTNVTTARESRSEKHQKEPGTSIRVSPPPQKGNTPLDPQNNRRQPHSRHSIRSRKKIFQPSPNDPASARSVRAQGVASTGDKESEVPTSFVNGAQVLSSYRLGHNGGSSIRSSYPLASKVSRPVRRVPLSKLGNHTTRTARSCDNSARTMVDEERLNIERGSKRKTDCGKAIARFDHTTRSTTPVVSQNSSSSSFRSPLGPMPSEKVTSMKLSSNSRLTSKPDLPAFFPHQPPDTSSSSSLGRIPPSTLNSIPCPVFAHPTPLNITAPPMMKANPVPRLDLRMTSTQGARVDNFIRDQNILADPASSVRWGIVTGNSTGMAASHAPMGPHQRHNTCHSIRVSVPPPQPHRHSTYQSKYTSGSLPQNSLSQKTASTNRRHSHLPRQPQHHRYTMNQSEEALDIVEVVDVLSGSILESSVPLTPQTVTTKNTRCQDCKRRRFHCRDDLPPKATRPGSTIWPFVPRSDPKRHTERHTERHTDSASKRTPVPTLAFTPRGRSLQEMNHAREPSASGSRNPTRKSISPFPALRSLSLSHSALLRQLSPAASCMQSKQNTPSTGNYLGGARGSLEDKPRGSVCCTRATCCSS